MMDIRFNNNKTFMQEHREQYIEVMRTPYYQLIESLAPTMLEISPNMEVRPAKCLSRIFRDTRFSHDKSPYRDHHWVAFRQAGVPRMGAPMYWMEIRIEKVSWGLGYWGENKGATDIMRRRMLAKPDEFAVLNKILNKYHYVVAGDEYKRISIPDNLHSAVQSWYPKKELLFIRQNINPDVIFSTRILELLSQEFKALAPIYHMMQGSYELALHEEANQ